MRIKIALLIAALLFVPFSGQSYAQKSNLQGGQANIPIIIVACIGGMSVEVKQSWRPIYQGSQSVMFRICNHSPTWDGNVSVDEAVTTLGKSAGNILTCRYFFGSNFKVRSGASTQLVQFSACPIVAR